MYWSHRRTNPDALERPREEGAHGHKLPRGMDFDVVLADFGVEALERLDLLLGELDLALADRPLQPEQSLVAGLEAARGSTRPAPRPS